MSRHLVLLESSWAETNPQVRARQEDDRSSSLIPLLGLTLHYQLPPSPRRICLGHRAFGSQGSEYIDCTRPPKPGSKKCVRCAVHEATFASTIHHAHTKDRSGIDRFFAQHLSKPNVLYLAAFRDGSIKVGTSTKERVHHRLAEQGAWLAHLVATTSDGYVVREIEDLVTEFVGLPQAVSSRRKLAGLLQPVPDSGLTAELADLAAKVIALLNALPDDRVESLDQTWSNPAQQSDSWANLVKYPLALETGKHQLTVTQACGRILGCVRQRADGATEAETYLVDIGNLYGYQLELGDVEPDEITLQTALF